MHKRWVISCSIISLVMTMPCNLSVGQTYIFGLYVSTHCPEIGKFTTSDFSMVWINEPPAVTSGSYTCYPTAIDVLDEYIFALYEGSHCPAIAKFTTSDLSTVWINEPPAVTSGPYTCYPGALAVSGDYIYALYISTHCPAIGKFTTSDFSKVWINEPPAVTSGSYTCYPTKIAVSGDYIYALYGNSHCPAIAKFTTSDLSTVWINEPPAVTSGPYTCYPGAISVYGDYIYALYISTYCPAIGKFTTSDLSTVWINKPPAVTSGSYTCYPGDLDVWGDNIYTLYGRCEKLGMFTTSNLSTVWIEEGFPVVTEGSFNCWPTDIAVSKESPTVVEDPTGQTVCLGTMAQFSVTASGEDLSYQWQKNGSNLSDGGHYSGVTSPTLTISNTDNNDVASYRCVVTNMAGSATSNSAALTLLQEVGISDNPDSASKCAGESVTFSVSATGTLPLNYQWLKNSNPISGETGTSYTVSSASVTDTGSYSCRVSNACNTMISNEATLTVNPQTSISGQPNSQIKLRGETATFTITADGTNLSYQWQKDGSDLTYGGDISGIDTDTLEITNVDSNDEGNYRCAVTGECGTDTSDKATLTVYGGTVLYVDCNAINGGDGLGWETAYSNLQEALVMAGGSGGFFREIRVAAGEYKPADPGGDRSATFELLNGVTIRGGYAGFGELDPDAQNVNIYESILSGDINDNDTQSLDPCDLLVDPNRGDNSYHVVTGSNTGASAILCGFTINKGNSNGSDSNSCGGGMLNENGSPTVINCIFSENSAINQGGGIANLGTSEPMFINCRFNCNLAGSKGGAMANSSSDPVLINCTLNKNSATDVGGGIYNLNSDPNLSNSILWANSAISGAQMYNEGTSFPSIRYCDVEGGYLGIGNISVNPMFIDANGSDGISGTSDDNLRLGVGSPCIDKGNNNLIPVDITDLDCDGNTVEPTPMDLESRHRIVNGSCSNTDTVDMGAYEFTSSYIGDFDGNCVVNLADLKILVSNWELSLCNLPDWCELADIDLSMRVDFFDFAIQANNWLIELHDFEVIDCYAADINDLFTPRETIYEGQEIQVCFKMSYSGPGDSATIHIQLDDEVPFEVDDFFASGTYVYSYPWTAVFGSHRVQGWCDFNNDLNETNESNNYRDENPSFTVTGMSHDFTAIDCYVADANDLFTPLGTVYEGNNVRVCFKLSYAGPGATVTTRIQLDNEAPVDFNGSVTEGTWIESFPWTATAGDHRLRGWCDFNDVVAETNESNNYLDENPSFTVEPPPSTKLLIHCDGNDGSQSFVDSSPSAHVITALGDAQVSTAIVQFGTGSLMLDGNGDYLIILDSNDWDLFLQANFTIEFWAHHSTLSGYQTFMCQYEGPGDRWMFSKDDDGQLRFYSESGGGVLVNFWSASGIMPANDWYHVALCKVGDDYGIYLDGSQVAYVSDADSDAFAGTLHIGCRNADQYVNGWLDEIHIAHNNHFDASPKSDMSDMIHVPGEPPTITEQPQSQSVLPGQAVIFTLAATGSGTLTYQWQKDGTDLTDGNGISGVNTTILQIANVSLDDEGDYRCVVTGDHGVVTSDAATLTVIIGPKLLIHCDGANGSQSFYDSSPSAHTITAHGEAQVDTAIVKLGTGSLMLDGNGDYLESADHADWDILTKTNFTVDFWIKINSGNNQAIITQAETIDDNWDIWYDDHSYILLRQITGGSHPLILQTGVELTDAQWHHVTVIKVSSDYGIYVDGFQKAYLSYAGSDTYSGPLYIGQFGWSASYLNGFLDEIRITHNNYFEADPQSDKSDVIAVPSAPYSY